MNSLVIEQPFSTRSSNSFTTSSVNSSESAAQSQVFTSLTLASVGQSTLSFAQALLRAFSIPAA